MLILLIVLLGSCTSFHPRMLQPEDNPIDNKILKLNVSSQNDVQRVSSEEYKEVGYQSLYYTIFERELRQNILKNGNKDFGSIELTIIYDKYTEHFGWEILSGSTLLVFNVVGMPLDFVEQYTEVEIKLFDQTGKEIKRYNIIKEIKKYTGFYYNHKYSSMDVEEYVKVVAFKSIIKELKYKLSNDAVEINKILRS